MLNKAFASTFAAFAVSIAATSLGNAAQQTQLPMQSVPPVSAANRVISPHLADAEKLLAELPNATLNVYGEDKTHRPFIDWNPSRPAARTVCSTFAVLLLEHTYGFTRSQITDWLHSATPDADRVYDAIRENKGFRGFHEIARIRPGDFLASKFFGDSKDTGHVMVVDEAPVQIPASEPIIPGTTQYAVTVIDSTSGPHGPTDTRLRPDGSHTTGIGRGVFRIYGDAAGRIAGYTWSISPTSKFYAAPARRLIAGRLTRGAAHANESESDEAVVPAVRATAAASP